MPVAKYLRTSMKRINLKTMKGRKPLLNTEPVDLFDIQMDLLSEVMDYGRHKVTEDGEIVWESDRPVECELLRQYTTFNEKPIGFGKKALDQYGQQLMNPDKGEFAYTYGERIMPNLDTVMKMLRQHHNTRRAVINISCNDDRKNPFMPCMQQILFTIDYNGYLQMDITFRSHDILSAWYSNAYGLLYLQNEICNKYQYAPGILRIISFHPHFYPIRDAEELKKIGVDPEYYSKEQPLE